jgi:endo-1,4-beta-xylanase
MNAKSDAIYEMLRGMVERGVPVDGVGLQMHQGAPNGDIPLAEFVENMNRLAALGLEVLISEMDIHTCLGKTPEEQRQEYHDIVAACVALPECPAVTFWGITDQYSRLKNKTTSAVL